MKSLSNILGILLILFGIVALAYQGITYTKREKVAQIGSVEITADKDKTVTFPPMLGGLSLIAGIVLVVVGRRQ
jgi:hypothetical protein